MQIILVSVPGAGDIRAGVGT